MKGSAGCLGGQQSTTPTSLVLITVGSDCHECSAGRVSTSAWREESEGKEEKGGRKEKEGMPGRENKIGERLLAPLLLLIALVVMDSNPPSDLSCRRNQLVQRLMARAAKGKESVVGMFLLWPPSAAEQWHDWAAWSGAHPFWMGISPRNKPYMPQNGETRHFWQQLSLEEKQQNLQNTNAPTCLARRESPRWWMSWFLHKHQNLMLLSASKNLMEL